MARRDVSSGSLNRYLKFAGFFLLGLAYFEGEGVAASFSKATKLFERANIDDDHPAARKMLSQLRG